MTDYLIFRKTHTTMFFRSRLFRATFVQMGDAQLLEYTGDTTMPEDLRKVAQMELTARAEEIVARIGSSMLKLPPFLNRYMQGRERLWKAFWILNAACGCAINYPVQSSFSDDGNATAVLIYVFVIVIPFHIFAGLAMWRCAFNSWRANKRLVFAIGARAMAVLSWLYTASLALLIIQAKMMVAG